MTTEADQMPSLGEYPWRLDVGTAGMVWGNTQHLFFLDQAAADAAYERVSAAWKAYRDRVNDREAMIEVADEMGRLTLDVSHISTVRTVHASELDRLGVRMARETRAAVNLKATSD